MKLLARIKCLAGFHERKFFSVLDSQYRNPGLHVIAYCARCGHVLDVFGEAEVGLKANPGRAEAFPPVPTPQGTARPI